MSLPEFDPTDPLPLPYRRVPGVRVSVGKSSEEGTDFFLKSPTGHLLMLQEQERFLWDLLDGTLAFTEIERSFGLRFDMGLTAFALAALLTDLLEAQAVERIPESERRETHLRARAKRIEFPAPVAAAAAPAAASFTFSDADEIATGQRAGGRGSSGRGPGRMGQGRTGRDGTDRRGMGRRPADLEEPSDQREKPAPGGAHRDPHKTPWSVSLGNPEKLLNAISRVFWPVRQILWIFVPLTLLSFLIVAKHSTEYYADLGAMSTKVSVYPCAWLAEHAISWSARFVEAVVIHGFGRKVQEMHIKFLMGIFIRLGINHDDVSTMPRPQKMWIYAAPLTYRFALFAVGILAWILLRQTHPNTSQFFLFVGSFGLLTAVFTACPLLPFYGARMLGLILGQDNLHARAFKFVGLKLKGRRSPDIMTAAERWGLVFLGVGTFVATGLYIAHIFYHLSERAASLNGIGYWLIVGVFILAFLYFYTLIKMQKKIRAMHRASRVRQPQRGPTA